ncbi:hypothetical protein WDU94_001899 [Cyamophila willieti]
MISNWRKTEIMRNKKKLSGTRIYLENDMSEEDRAEKKNMIEEMKDLKSKGHEAYLKGKTLIVNMDKGKQKEEMQHETNETQETEVIMEQQPGSSQLNNTIYKTPLNTPGKRQLSPENINQIRKMLTNESKIKKKKTLQIQRSRTFSDGQKTLDSMLARKEETNNDPKNIGYMPRPVGNASRDASTQAEGRCICNPLEPHEDGPSATDVTSVAVSARPDSPPKRVIATVDPRRVSTFTRAPPPPAPVVSETPTPPQAATLPPRSAPPSDVPAEVYDASRAIIDWVARSLDFRPRYRPVEERPRQHFRRRSTWPTQPRRPTARRISRGGHNNTYP